MPRKKSASQNRSAAKPTETADAPGKKPTRKPGRPCGSRTKPRAHVHHVPARCPHCQSTFRSSFREAIVRTTEFGGTAPDGKPYTHVVHRRTTCKDCGGAMALRTYEYRPDNDAEKELEIPISEEGSALTGDGEPA